MFSKSDSTTFLRSVPDSRRELHAQLLERLVTNPGIDLQLSAGGRSYAILIDGFNHQVLRVIGREQDAQRNPRRRDRVVDHDLAIDFANVPTRAITRFREIWSGWCNPESRNQPLIRGGLHEITVGRYIDKLHECIAAIST